MCPDFENYKEVKSGKDLACNYVFGYKSYEDTGMQEATEVGM
jgi:hypothetical protein